MASLVLSGDTSGSITVSAPAVAGSTTQTLVNVTGTLAPIVQGTAVASTSGTSIDFTGIPSWVKRITVLFNGVSTNGTSAPIVQIGAGSFTTSGYAGVSNATVAGGATSGGNYTTGFGITSANAANILHGHMVIVNITGNTWVASHAIGTTGTIAISGGAALALSGTLDRVRITTETGVNTFDAGTINLLWE